MEKSWVNYIVFFLSVLLLFSCKSVKLSDAEEKQRIGEYYEAAAIYRKVYTKTPPKDRDLRGYIAFRMADCNRLINNTNRAVSAYTNALRYNYPDSIVNLRLGQMHHKNGRYNDAIKYYNDFLQVNPTSVLALNGIKGSEQAPVWRQNPTRYEVKRMDKFNSKRSEFSPMLNGMNYDQLYFASSRSKDKEAKVSAITGLNNNNLFVVKQDENGNWLNPVELEDAVNTEFDEGTPSFSPDGNTMYYTYCSEDPEGSRTSEIYISTRSNAAWGKGQRAAIVKDSVTALGHPSASPDGKYLYFVSDAVGGYGGKDIFRARIFGNGFGPMENLGPQINTPGDEMFPYVRDSTTLYFSSNGHPGMGGLDIFKATQDSTGNWHVENMKAPINSMGDDFGITFASRREKGFFSSNRNDARGNDHLYSFELPVITVFIEGIVFDVDEYPIENASIQIVGRDGLNKKAIAKKDGTYRIELERDVSYVMMASARGYLNQNFELKTGPEEKNETYIVDFFLSPIYRPVVVENIFYDFDKATLRPESKEGLDDMIKMLNDNPNVTIELGAHTDRKGTDEYNERLAQRRAQSVVDYLIAGGIASDRLEAKGYGESVPKVINKKMAEEFNFLKDGDVLTEEFILTLPPEQQEIADQINRRTEFKVLRTNYNLF
ncbi:peptidoglycan-associated lipoprotein [Parabacteroides sp. PF5-5]|uniref:PorE family type IX secretion system protein n=1 Tax=unclassified Parabacteroides TaxID=2649774 RepID=UPI002473C109|nr:MULTISPECIES: OmpA family protein [unclassified Parabacteroides]MDH6316597.1 peptidoglycan-associated lipoprotein [Parabacteroides sp. PF5-13]MDH6327900.1 peptidoglycan-associated lipoprotein [Parabacteroides sp. PH5-41]MDH6335584.1 peptidoglycan-associated lipoprotein [Parabacteroides sp. PF5-5]MDH6346764.1 peptidoglycan-associated lipoprotein [Parabacteroides sp. PH5-46]MDH6361610.1 peptidoglycan-associated lipoprotein [Parabacteroides sp. PH5-16]